MKEGIHKITFGKETLTADNKIFLKLNFKIKKATVWPN